MRGCCARCTLETFQKNVLVQLDRDFWLEIEDLLRKRLNGRLRSPALHLLERGFVPWCQCCPCQTLTGSGNFTTPDVSLSNSGLLLVGHGRLPPCGVPSTGPHRRDQISSSTLLCQHDPCFLVGGATRMAINRTTSTPGVLVFRLRSKQGS